MQRSQGQPMGGSPDGLVFQKCRSSFLLFHTMPLVPHSGKSWRCPCFGSLCPGSWRTAVERVWGLPRPWQRGLTALTPVTLLLGKRCLCSAISSAHQMDKAGRYLRKAGSATAHCSRHYPVRQKRGLYSISRRLAPVLNRNPVNKNWC